MDSELFRKAVSPEGQRKGKKGISMRQMASRVNRAAKLRTEDVLFLCKEHPQRRQHLGAGICSPL